MSEEKFGFHSEYYISCSELYLSEKERNVCYGYFEYSEYKGDIYCLSNQKSGYLIIKSNPKTKSFSIIPINTKNNYKYIAVNNCGYYLYDKKQITLFDFNGNEINSHKIKNGGTEKKECLYIYDDTVFLTDTRGANCVTSIYSINMCTNEERELWRIEKGNDIFDNALAKMYQNKWKAPLKIKVSGFNKRNALFLYANEKRIIAGFKRESQYAALAYIVNINRETLHWGVVDCSSQTVSFRSGNVCGMDVFSFDMLRDTWWLHMRRTGKQEGLFQVAIGNNKVIDRWACEELYRGDGSASQLVENGDFAFYYFDGKYLLCPKIFTLDGCNKEDGSWSKVWDHLHTYQSKYFWIFGDYFIIDNEFPDIRVWMRNINTDVKVPSERNMDVGYTIHYFDIDAKMAEQDQEAQQVTSQAEIDEKLEIENERKVENIYSKPSTEVPKQDDKDAELMRLIAKYVAPEKTKTQKVFHSVDELVGAYMSYLMKIASATAKERFGTVDTDYCMNLLDQMKKDDSIIEILLKKAKEDNPDAEVILEGWKKK